MINKFLISGRLELIADYLTQMQRLSNIPKNDFLKHKDMVAAAESYLRRAVEARACRGDGVTDTNIYFAILS